MFFQAVRGVQELAEQGLWHPTNLLYFGALKPGMLHGPFWALMPIEPLQLCGGRFEWQQQRTEGTKPCNDADHYHYGDHPCSSGSDCSGSTSATFYCAVSQLQY